MERMLMICGEYVEIMLIFAQYSIHILSNQQLVTSTGLCAEIYLLHLPGETNKELFAGQKKSIYVL